MSSVSKPRVRQNRHKQGLNQTLEKISADFRYIKMAADVGNVDACGILSYFYENGIGCNKDPEKAKEYKDKTVAKEDKKEEN